MSTQMNISVELNVIQRDKTYYVYNSRNKCLTSAHSINKLKENVQIAFASALGVKVQVSIGKSLKIKPEPLKHEGKHL